VSRLTWKSIVLDEADAGDVDEDGQKIAGSSLME
jgi:hypothetical protein